MRDNGNYNAFRIAQKKAANPPLRSRPQQISSTARPDVDPPRHSATRRQARQFAPAAPERQPTRAPLPTVRPARTPAPGRRYTAPKPRGHRSRTAGNHAPTPSVHTATSTHCAPQHPRADGADPTGSQLRTVEIPFKCASQPLHSKNTCTILIQNKPRRTRRAAP